MNRGRKPSLFFRTDVFDHVRNHGFFPKQNPNILRLQSSTLKKCLFRVFRYEKLSCPARHQGVSKKNAPFHRVGGWYSSYSSYTWCTPISRRCSGRKVDPVGTKKCGSKKYPKNKKGDMFIFICTIHKVWAESSLARKNFPPGCE